MKKLGISRPR